MNKKIKIMLAQLNPTVGDLEKNSKIVMDTYDEASKKKVLIGPKNNQVDFDRIIYAEQNEDLELLGQTTLMIRNIPIKFT